MQSWIDLVEQVQAGEKDVFEILTYFSFELKTLKIGFYIFEILFVQEGSNVINPNYLYLIYKCNYNFSIYLWILKQ
jgi:hypothetical protein